jgi:hypothetical protein
MNLYPAFSLLLLTSIDRIALRKFAKREEASSMGCFVYSPSLPLPLFKGEGTPLVVK